MICFERIKEWQERFYTLHKVQIHEQLETINASFTERDNKEMIYILGELLYHMKVTGVNEI